MVCELYWSFLEGSGAVTGSSIDFEIRNRGGYWTMQKPSSSQAEFVGYQSWPSPFLSVTIQASDARYELTPPRFLSGSMTLFHCDRKICSFASRFYSSSYAVVWREPCTVPLLAFAFWIAGRKG